MADTPPFLIVGLGNPGRDYRDNHHNIGFMLLDRLAVGLGVTFNRLQSRALVVIATYEGHRVILAKPQTYMNLSGLAVGELVRYYKLPLGQFLVAHDDLDLPLGTIRIRPEGGAAGQKGMLSIIEQLGTQQFPRLRLGIGRPPGRMDPADYVLKNFSRSELETLTEVLDRAGQAALTVVAEGLEAAMNRFNGSVEDEQNG